MGDLYLRVARVTIFPPAGPPRVMEELRTSFQIEKSNASSPNTMTLEIYNMAEASRSAVENDQTTVVVDVGYEDTVERMFIGNVTRAIHEQSGPDIITSIEVSDGGNRYTNAHADFTYPPNSTHAEVITDLVDRMGLNTATIQGVPDGQYSRGYSVSGNIRRALDDITRQLGLEWSIQDEAVQIIPQNLTTTDAPIVLNTETGLVGSPNKTDTGVEFVSLLQPRLRPGRQATIQSRFVNGTFKLRRVIHRGDNQQGDFLSECEASR